MSYTSERSSGVYWKRMVESVIPCHAVLNMTPGLICHGNGPLGVLLYHLELKIDICMLFGTMRLQTNCDVTVEIT